MSYSNKAVIIIPFYKENLTAYECIALKQCFKILKGHSIIAIKPRGLNMPEEVKNYSFLKYHDFDDEYFKDVQGYNRLMLSAEFYREFLDYEFMLIYQLDAFVFKDDLNYWCSQVFDYIGAPWIRATDYKFFKRIKRKIQYYIHTRYNIQKEGLPSIKQLEYKVGNGGFSLRRTQIFYDLCIKYHDKIEEYNKIENHLYNEDVFWSVEVNRKKRNLKIPVYKKALKFSIEFHPQKALITNKGQLPFGCHAWDLNIDFWKPIFKELGYEI
jgi:hypothetical protein